MGMNDSEYRKKYLKYKLKYLQLKQNELTGGAVGESTLSENALSKSVFEHNIQKFKDLAGNDFDAVYDTLQEIMFDTLKDLEKTRTDITDKIRADREQWFKGGFRDKLTAATLDSLGQDTTGVGYTVYLNTLFGLKESNYEEFTPRKDNFFSSIGT